MSVTDIRQKISEFVKERDKFDAPHLLDSKAKVHWWARGRLLCSTRKLDPVLADKIEDVTCCWCLGRIDKGVHL